MKRHIKTNTELSENTIKVIMYLHPNIYANSEVVLGSVNYDPSDKKYHTDVNPNRVINGPLSDYGQELEPPISEEYDSFIEDCDWLIHELGFTIISQHRSTDSKKSEYIVVFGIDDTPCGSIIYELRISDHPFDAKFPEEIKDQVVEYLNMNNVMNGQATKAGIDFSIENVLVGSVKNDTWDKAFQRLYLKLKQLRRRIKIRLHQ